jgi:polar amino acid transport system substrate-binding protein
MPAPLPRLLAAVLVIAAGLAAPPVAGLTLLTEENPPFNYTDNGKLTGMAVEIVGEMVKRANIPATTEVLPWDQAYVRAQAQKGTCLYSTARQENRERQFVWIGPIATNLWAVFGKSDFAAPVRTLKDLQPFRIGAVTRDAKAEYLREAGVTNVRTVPADADNPPRLLRPRDDPDAIDLWITGLYAGRDVATAAKVTDIKLVFIAAEQQLYLACSPQTPPATIKALADALESVKADGTLKRITADYERRFAK